MSVFDNPYRLFDVRGKAALITGASGAFGAWSRPRHWPVPAASWCWRPAMPTSARCHRQPNARRSAPRSSRVNARPEDEELCQEMVDLKRFRGFGRLDILLSWLRHEQGRQLIDDMEPETILPP